MSALNAEPNLTEDIPITYIRPARGWATIDFRELWHFRELFGFLIWRDVLVKYKQTLFGFAWAILVPLIQMVIFGTIFGQIAGLPTDGLPQYLFYFTNLTLWAFFSNAFNRTSISLVQNANLLTKIYFPRLLMPAASCVSGAVDFLIALTIMLVMALWMGKYPAWTMVLIPLLLAATSFTALGMGLFFSALNVRYRDVTILIPFITQIWMYCTIIVPYSKIAHKLGPFAWLYGLNPMASVIEIFRWCLFRKYLAAPVPWQLLCSSVPMMFVMFLIGLFYFRRTEKVFADIV